MRDAADSQEGFQEGNTKPARSRTQRLEAKGHHTPMDPEVVHQVDHEILHAMPKELRQRLTLGSPDRLTLRQMHNAGGAYLATLACHPEFRKRVVAEALQNPLVVLKIASSERPKESLIEVETHKTVVMLPSQADPDVWQKMVSQQATLGINDPTEAKLPWADEPIMDAEADAEADAEEDMYG